MEEELKNIIRELVKTYIIELDEDGRPRATMIELLDLSRRTMDAVDNTLNKPNKD